MRQTLHIFAKDVRLYWSEILATLTVTALFVWIYPMGWGDPLQRVPVWVWVPGAITGLVPVSWLVLITRVIHAESLVGERQFWITRPYRWPELISSKALFIAAFVYVPFFVAQCILLREAGMHPLAHLPGLFFNLLLTTGIAVLPMACLAAVTSNFPKMLLGLLCLILFVAGVAYLSSLLPSSSTTNSFGDVLGFIAPVSVFVAVLIIQYARRWTVLARALLTALAVTISVVGLFGPEDFAMGITYPVRADAKGLHLEFRRVPALSTSSVSNSVDEREFSMVFPIAISGIAPDTAVKVDNARITLKAAGGVQWTSHWQGLYLTWLPGQTNGTVALKISRAFYRRMKDKPVTVEMSLALTMLKSGKMTQVILPENRFELPGGSVCLNSGVWGNDISCLSPMRQPPLMLVTTRFTTEECSAASPSNGGDGGIGWIGTLDTQPADFGLTSVWGSTVYFERLSSTRSSEQQHLCPGSQISFAPYTVVSRSQQKIVSQPLDLKSLVPSRF
jgi:hypothetical protein